MPEVEDVISESALLRGCRDFKVRFSSVWFWVSEIFIGTYLSIEYDPLVALVGIVFLAISIATAAVLTAPLRQRNDLREYAKTLIPQIELGFDPGRGGVTETPEKKKRNDVVVAEFKAKYIRVWVKAKSRKTVHDCSAYLIGVEKQNERFEFENTTFFDPIQCPWSLLGVGSVDLPYMLRRSIDILKVDDRGKATSGPNFCGAWPLTLRNIFQDKTVYKFTILVCGEGISETISINVYWTGDYNAISASDIKDIQKNLTE